MTDEMTPEDEAADKRILQCMRAAEIFRHRAAASPSLSERITTQRVSMMALLEAAQVLLHSFDPEANISLLRELSAALLDLNQGAPPPKLLQRFKKTKAASIMTNLERARYAACIDVVQLHPDYRKPILAAAIKAADLLKVGLTGKQLLRLREGVAEFEYGPEAEHSYRRIVDAAKTEYGEGLCDPLALIKGIKPSELDDLIASFLDSPVKPSVIGESEHATSPHKKSKG